MPDIHTVARVDVVTHAQAKTMAELTEGEFSEGAIEEFRSYRSAPHVIFTIRKPYSRDEPLTREYRSFIIDRTGGYYRLPPERD